MVVTQALVVLMAAHQAMAFSFKDLLGTSDEKCTGAADPKQVPLCFKGAITVLGMQEAVLIDVVSYSAGKGSLNIQATGVRRIACTRAPRDSCPSARFAHLTDPKWG